MFSTSRPVFHLQPFSSSVLPSTRLFSHASAAVLARYSICPHAWSRPLLSADKKRSYLSWSALFASRSHVLFLPAPAVATGSQCSLPSPVGSFAARTHRSSQASSVCGWINLRWTWTCACCLQARLPRSTSQHSFSPYPRTRVCSTKIVNVFVSFRFPTYCSTCFDSRPVNSRWCCSKHNATTQTQSQSERRLKLH